jgi:hypothetical protein
MTNMLPDTDEIVNEFNRQQLKKDWLDIIIDKDGQDSDKNSDDKHNKINELLDIYWEY